MRRRYLLAPSAVLDLASIWNYVSRRATVAMADRVEATIRAKIAMLAVNPAVGHTRSDLTDEPVRFLSVWSYLIVYLPDSKPLKVVRILHGYRDVERQLGEP